MLMFVPRAFTFLGLTQTNLDRHLAPLGPLGPESGLYKSQGDPYGFSHLIRTPYEFHQLGPL